MKATTHQVDKLIELCLSLSQHAKAKGEIYLQQHPTFAKAMEYDVLIASFEKQIGVPLADFRSMDAISFAYHLGYFAGRWEVRP